MSSDKSSFDVRRSEVLNVAISTDTILYTPFFLAYNSGDFENTPFGKLSVNIIGSSDDARFIDNRKLKGDGFSTFCLLFGLADAAICDPSFLVYIQKTGVLVQQFSDFEELLTPETKSALSDDRSAFKDYVEIKNGKLEIKDISKFEELFSDKRVIGGLISKIAFSIAGSPDLEEIANSVSYREREKFNKISNRKNIKDFPRDEITGNFIYYKSPSTGFCIGEIFSKLYSKTTANKTVPEDFGKELKKLTLPENNKSIAITCDFVSLDYILKKERVANEKKIIELESLAEDNDSEFMYTGILGNCVPNNFNKLKALLYGIDKNLFYIYQFLKGSDTTGLTKYFRKKFHNSKTNKRELLNLLVADEGCQTEIQTLIDNGNFTFDTIIKYYVDRLYKCKKYGGLYFNSTIPSESALKNMVKLRYESHGDSIPENEDFIKPFIQSDLLSDWRKREKKFFEHEKRVNDIIHQPSKKEEKLFKDNKKKGGGSK